MKILRTGLLLALSFALWASASESTTGSGVEGPVEHVYATHDGVDLKAYVFTPGKPATEPRSAILVLHGGGWSIGEAAWGFGRAEHFAKLGMVGVAVQYRLSGAASGITPLEAMADVRAAVRWVRVQAETLGIATHRVAAYGWSAGAHLAACAAIFDGEEASEISAAPDLLILVSPALSLHHDVWLKRILGDRATPADISPDAHVRAGMPPALVLQGRTDTVTPLDGSQRFCDRMNEAGNDCTMVVYDGVGHLFTPAGEPDDGWPNPDPEISAAAKKEADRFLVARGFVATDALSVDESP